MGPWDGHWVVPGIAPPGPPHIPIPGYTLPMPALASRRVAAPWHAKYMAVGLISVGQLTLRALFLDLRTITEVYNLVRIEDR